MICGLSNALICYRSALGGPARRLSVWTTRSPGGRPRADREERVAAALTAGTNPAAAIVHEGDSLRRFGQVPVAKQVFRPSRVGA
jgi:hypothetical protein